MGRVEENEAAIDSLPPEVYIRVLAWIREHEQSRRDEQMNGIRQRASWISRLWKLKATLWRRPIASGRREREIGRTPRLPATVFTLSS
jgi:hypothetical protein